MVWIRYLKQGRCLRPGLSAHTAQALATRPVSAPSPNAGRRTIFTRETLRNMMKHGDYQHVSLYFKITKSCKFVIINV